MECFFKEASSNIMGAVIGGVFFQNVPLMLQSTAGTANVCRSGLNAVS